MAVEGARPSASDLLAASSALGSRWAERTSLRADSDLRQRIEGLVSVAAANGCTISLDELHALLPLGPFPSSDSLGRFLDTDREMRERLIVAGAQVVPRERSDLLDRRAVQQALTADRLARAERFLARLERVCPWIEMVGVSGSVAYGGTKPHDDVDFFLVTRARRMWLSLAAAMVLARIERWRDPPTPVYCFNRVTEGDACMASFRGSDDPLFAREALNLRILRGHDFYQGLLRASPWMEKHFPRLYGSRLEAVEEMDEPPARTGSVGTFLNLAAYVALGSYLWSVGLIRNARHARAGHSGERFRTVVERDFCAYESKKYDDLRDLYGRTV